MIKRQKRNKKVIMVVNRQRNRKKGVQGKCRKIMKSIGRMVRRIVRKVVRKVVKV